jgi:hypothetical protein
MPLQKITLRSGVNRENTRYTNEGGWYESDKVRFRQGTPEKIGGWTRISISSFAGICRSLWNWLTLKGQNLLGVGTDRKFYIENGGTYNDITPFRATVTLTNPFTTTLSSAIVTVTDTAGGYKNNDYVIFYNSTAVGGLTILGQYLITYVTGNTYTITASTTATSAATGGGTVYAAYFLSGGSSSGTAAFVGWGSGNWGDLLPSGNVGWGGDGVTNVISSLLLWNQSNFGQDLVYGQRGGPLYYWSANIGLTESSVTISAASPGVLTGAVLLNMIEGQSIIFDTTGVLPTPLLPGVTYYIKSLVGATSNISATGGGTAINTTGGSGTHYIMPNGTLLSTSNGASAVPTACNYFLISDTSRFVLAFGTYDYASPVFDPMVVRWSDQNSLIQWTPSITNQAGSVRLSKGSAIITALQSRQEILVWTDSALYQFQYLGPPYVWGNQLLADNVSIVGPACRALASGVVYWMGADKFYMYDGRVQTLNCDLREYIYSNINISQASQFFASTNEGFNEIWFFYCSGASTTVDSYVIYNYLEKIWYYGSMGRTAWLDSGIRQYPMAATYVNNIVYHEAGIDDNSTATPTPITSSITSSQFDIGDGDRFAFIYRMLPDLTFTGSTAGTSPSLTMYLQPLVSSGSGYTTPASVAGPNANASAAVTGIVPVNIDQYTGQVNIRVRGRQMSIKITCNTLGTQWQLGSPRIDIRPDGRRS